MGIGHWALEEYLTFLRTAIVVSYCIASASTNVNPVGEGSPVSMFENPKIGQPAPTEREDFILVYLQHSNPRNHRSVWGGFIKTE